MVYKIRIALQTEPLQKNLLIPVMARLKGFEPADPSPVKGSPAGPCPLWLLPRTSGESFP